MIDITDISLAKPLQEGSEVLTVAASSGITDEGPLLEGLRIFEEWGLRCRPHQVTGRHWGYLAGNDLIRFKELHPEEPASLIAFARGGWGAARLLERYQPWKEGWILGFSDVTALLLSRLAAGFDGCIHGPLITSLSKEPDWSKERLKSILFGQTIPDLQGEDWQGGIAKGPIVAANLTVASHLIGSKHIPDLRGAILVLEDIGEEPYRIDRMLTQFRLAGLLKGLKGLAFGKFIDCEYQDKTDNDRTFSLKEVLRERSLDLKIPVVANLPIGHCHGNAALPLGRDAILDGGKGILKLLP